MTEKPPDRLISRDSLLQRLGDIEYPRDLHDLPLFLDRWIPFQHSLGFYPSTRWLDEARADREDVLWLVFPNGVGRVSAQTRSPELSDFRGEMIVRHAGSSGRFEFATWREVVALRVAQEVPPAADYFPLEPTQLALTFAVRLSGTSVEVNVPASYDLELAADGNDREGYFARAEGFAQALLEGAK
jgi:hypothetical protein